MQVDWNPNRIKELIFTFDDYMSPAYVSLYIGLFCIGSVYLGRKARHLDVESVLRTFQNMYPLCKEWTTEEENLFKELLLRFKE